MREEGWRVLLQRGVVRDGREVLAQVGVATTPQTIPKEKRAPDDSIVGCHWENIQFCTIEVRGNFATHKSPVYPMKCTVHHPPRIAFSCKPPQSSLSTSLDPHQARTPTGGFVLSSDFCVAMDRKRRVFPPSFIHNIIWKNHELPMNDIQTLKQISYAFD